METAPTIDEVAAAWAAKADRGPLSADDQSALEEWAHADLRHAGAYARALAANAYFDRAVALGPDFSPDGTAVEEDAPPAPHRRRLIIGFGTAAAASALGLVGYRQLARRESIATAKGDVRRIALNEGSAITLNTDSRIEPYIQERVRRVDLVKGEALFDVTKDAARPFIVMAGEVRVHVVGTSFSVRRFHDDMVEITVMEGVVDVGTGGDAARQRLVVGQRTLVSAAGSVRTETLTGSAIDRSIAWRQGVLDLNGLTLSQAADEFARYSDQRISVADPALGAMQVTGVYSTSDPLGFARAAAISLGLETAAADGGILLRRSARK